MRQGARQSQPRGPRKRPAQAQPLIPLGRLVNTHGVRGEFRLLPFSFPCPTIREGLAVVLSREGEPASSLRVEGVKRRGPFVLVKLEGIDSKDQAQALIGSSLAASERDLPPLASGEFYHYRLIGTEVHTTEGERVGSIQAVFSTGAHDVWVVRRGSREHLIPVVEGIVQSLDIQGKRAIIKALEGLLD